MNNDFYGLEELQRDNRLKDLKILSDIIMRNIDSIPHDDYNNAMDILKKINESIGG